MPTTPPVKFRRSIATALALATALVLALAAQASAASVPSAPVPDLDWQPCDDGFECATATVPLDYDHPRGRTIELALIRDPADDQAHRIGSLFLNPGGPGGSGVGFLRGAPQVARDLAGRRFDLIGFDPRGVGASRPALDCGVDQETGGVYPQPFTRPDSDLGAHVRRARAYVRRCVERNGDLLAHVGTADVARDLDLLRAAVGDQRLSYLGLSYGTDIGATYASLFPGRARALVLDSAIDARTWTNEPFEAFREQTASGEDVIDRFFASCARNQAACGFGGDDPEDAFDDLAARLDERPLPAPGAAHPRPVDGDDVRFVAADLNYQQAAWPLLAEALAQAEAGNGTLMRELADDTYGRRPDGSYDGFWDVYFAVTALDQRYPRGVAPFLAAGRHSFALFDHFWFNSGYDELPQGISPYESRDVFRGPFRNAASAAPALVIGGTHDPATPYKWSKRLAADLGNARLMTVRGNGHGTVTSLDPCVLEPVLAYLEDGTLPPEGYTCRRPQPFPTAASARAQPRTAGLLPGQRQVR